FSRSSKHADKHMDAGPRERTTPGLVQGARLVRRGLVRDARVVGRAGGLDLGRLAAGHLATRPCGLRRRDRRAGRLRPTTAPPLADRAVVGRGDAARARGGRGGLRALLPRPLELDLLMTTMTAFACPGCLAETPA